MGGGGGGGGRGREGGHSLPTICLINKDKEERFEKKRKHLTDVYNLDCFIYIMSPTFSKNRNSVMSACAFSTMLENTFFFIAVLTY